MEVNPKIDFSYPSTGYDERNSSIRRDTMAFLEGEQHRLCPYHDNLKKEREKENAKRNNSILNNLFGKNPFQKKLKHYGIRMKVKVSKKKIHPNDEDTSDDLETFKFTRNELENCTLQQLDYMIATFEKKIRRLSQELECHSQEYGFHSTDTDRLNESVAELEELALRVMKPWVNTMPHSDEMTRVLLLN